MITWTKGALLLECVRIRLQRYWRPRQLQFHFNTDRCGSSVSTRAAGSRRSWGAVEVAGDGLAVLPQAPVREGAVQREAGAHAVLSVPPLHRHHRGGLGARGHRHRAKRHLAKPSAEFVENPEDHLFVPDP